MRTRRRGSAEITRANFLPIGNHTQNHKASDKQTPRYAHLLSSVGIRGTLSSEEPVSYQIALGLASLPVGCL